MPTPSPAAVTAVRRFGRFYTQRLGFLDEAFLSSGHTLPEARVLSEITHNHTDSAKRLSEDLALDPGHLSRVLAGLEERGVIRRRASPSDARRRIIELTARGRRSVERLDRLASQQVGQWLGRLSSEEQSRLVAAMSAIERTLDDTSDAGPPLVLRSHRHGDLGWVVSRHGALYGQEYGWEPTFEALVARLAGQFLECFDPSCERAWIAELDGERVGSIFATRYDATTAQLRMLLLERAARGRGLGRRMVNECVCFARSCGYRRMRLETVSILAAARHLYKCAGFEIVATEDKHTWGHDLTHERWEMEL